ncbi:hypothetical protein LC653_18525 [Nostoc sp. CHAB 5784]|uniref:hypothetical protein n=1 Tax=Nostoc mirabile TaxID=2907820 RepID=UPI001E5BA877|nr:hypothetical protein [Nostoc mirabile]MCC5665862.1 hypothetical protein [Nostoc mirabile CHAB5784]
MQPETEQILGTLQVIVEPYLTIDLPGHENGGTIIVPFVWDVSEQREFNVINLCLANGWLQLTDVDKRIKSWQEMEYAKSFYNFFLGVEEENIRKNKFESLLQLLHINLQNLEFFYQDLESFSSMPYSCSRGVILPGLVIGRTEDGAWICICPTVYKETAIPQELIHHWLCLAPTVPDQVSDNRRDRNQPTTQIISEESPSEATQTLITKVQILGASQMCKNIFCHCVRPRRSRRVRNEMKRSRSVS